MNDLTGTEYRASLRQDFQTFAQRCFHQLNPQASYLEHRSDGRET
jgi:hypothetical protein